jgi:hypothetical protein
VIDSDFQIHTVTVDTFLGSGPTGDVFAAPATALGLYVGGMVDEKETGGNERVERSSFYGSIEDAAKFTPRSKVTYAGRDSYVQQVFIHDDGDDVLGAFAGLAHIQVVLV